MNRTSSILWGIILIILGIIFGLNALEITNINIFFKGWWTLFLIVPGTIGLVSDRDKTGHLISIILGVALLLASWKIITFELIWKLSIPVILIISGLSILFKDIIGYTIRQKIKNIHTDTDDEYYAIFQHEYVDIDNPNGARINAIFGEIECDLRNAKINKDIVLDVTSVFGNTVILVPDDVDVKTSAIPLFGSVSKRHKTTPCKHTIYIRSTVMFGGVDIK